MYFSRQNSQFLDNEVRKVTLFRNGDFTISTEFSIKSGITFENLKHEALQKLGLKDKGTFRLFNSEGLELYDDYLPLIKDQENLYVSLGEDFDQATSLGDYIELSTLGQGGFGKVVLVQHRLTEKLFAAKYLDARKYGLASLIDMVFSEAELLKNLKHRGIVEILSFFKLKDLRVVFIMEYLEGGELGEYLKAKGQLAEDEAKDLFKQLVDAVHFCHMNKIIHRDLKLENILFESKDTNIIKVVDFGIAGLYSGYKFDVSDAGSLRYMAPEILNGKNRAANPAMDVWSMGCILYALLHGYPPFNGTTKKDIIDAIIKGEFKFDPKVRSRISVECIDLIRSMLKPDYITRINTFDIKDHPWFTGEPMDPDLVKLIEEEEEKEEEEAKQRKKDKEKTKEFDYGKKFISMKVNKEKPGVNTFSSRSKQNNSELKVESNGAYRVLGQNTLNRAISRDAKNKSDIAEKGFKGRLPLTESRFKEMELSKGGSAKKRLSTITGGTIEQIEKNSKSFEK